MASINVQFIGSFQEAAGVESKIYDIEENCLLNELFQRIVRDLHDGEGKSRLRTALGRRRADFLVLINGTEIGALQGFDSELRDGDRIVLIPVSHGG